jgi:manganese transport protein
MGDDKVGDMLILSQVILSLQLGFAVIPLIHFVSNKETMGTFVIKPLIKSLAWISAGIIVGLNIKLIIDTLGDWYVSLSDHIWIFDLIVIPGVAIAAVLLVYVSYMAIIGKSKVVDAKLPHGHAAEIPVLEKKTYSRVGICIDFSRSDIRAIENGVAQGDKSTQYYLFHCVESAGARSFGKEISDYETHEDWEYLQTYGERLRAQGFKVIEKLGFGEAGKIIPKLVKEVDTELLVIGKHGHKGVLDFIYGETIATVQHRVTCPILVV